MCACWRVTWQAPTAQPQCLSTSSACPSHHCHLPAWPGARHGELIGMAPRPPLTGPTDIQAITRRPMLLILTHTEGRTHGAECGARADAGPLHSRPGTDGALRAPHARGRGARYSAGQRMRTLPLYSDDL